MPALARRAKPDATKIYTCIEAFATADVACRRGLRLRGDHEYVERFPAFFADASLPDDELEELRRALYPDGQFFTV